MARLHLTFGMADDTFHTVVQNPEFIPGMGEFVVHGDYSGYVTQRNFQYKPEGVDVFITAERSQ